MNENKNKGRGVFYGVIGVATLVVAIIGATFAYFTAAAQNGINLISGNMASISFDLIVEKVVDPGAGPGMIPMSNHMVEAALNSNTAKPCVDAGGNAVCQIYKITVTNNSTASMFVDGYVALTGGSGIPEDLPNGFDNSTNPTTMRWAQVFYSGGTYSTAGTQILDKKNSISAGGAFTSIGNASDTDGFNKGNIKTAVSEVVTEAAADQSTGGTVINDKHYSYIDKNYIRVSNHAINAAEDGQNAPTINTTTEFNRQNDITSTLVLNQLLSPVADTPNNVAEYWFVVWLSENGHDQTANHTTGTGTGETTNPATQRFFNGVVRFTSAQGSEVTASFNGYTAVHADSVPNT